MRTNQGSNRERLGKETPDTGVRLAGHTLFVPLRRPDPFSASFPSLACDRPLTVRLVCEPRLEDTSSATAVGGVRKLPKYNVTVVRWPVDGMPHFASLVDGAF